MGVLAIFQPQRIVVDLEPCSSIQPVTDQSIAPFENM
jgi:hypothetical protein